MAINFPAGKRKDKPHGISEKVINLLKIIRALEEQKYPSVRQLAEECEVTERSVFRYLNIINSVIPVVFDRQKNGYRFTNKDAIKTLPLSREEFALLISLSEVASQMGSSFKDAFQRIMKRILPVGDSVKVFNVVMSSIEVDIDETLFNAITEAIVEKRRVRFQYHGVNTSETTTRKVDPYGLFYYDGIWFLYGYCHLRKAYRWFGLDRITSLRVLKERFNRLNEDEIQKNLRNAFTFWQNEGDVTEVTVRFMKPASDVIKRKKKWHNSEERKVLPDGEVELTFRVSSVDELKWWLYGWLPYVKVLKPEWLREQIKKELKEAIALYELQERD